ncbi:MAG: hypothetical protein ACPGU5_01045 [Lishizhenia sp.]
MKAVFTAAVNTFEFGIVLGIVFEKQCLNYLYVLVMKKIRFLIGLIIVLVLSSCVEIIEDLTVHKDGSGVFKMTLNLSQSATKITGLLALDSLNGKKVPSQQEIQEKLTFYQNQFAKKEGIIAVNTSLDFEYYILKLNIAFEHLSNLQAAFISIAEQDGIKNLDKYKAEQWITINDSVFNKKTLPVFEIASQRIKPEDKERLKEGSYISILRLDDEVVAVSNPKAKLSANKKNVMLHHNPTDIINNPKTATTRVRF